MSPLINDEILLLSFSKVRNKFSSTVTYYLDRLSISLTWRCFCERFAFIKVSNVNAFFSLIADAKTIVIRMIYGSVYKLRTYEYNQLRVEKQILIDSRM